MANEDEKPMGHAVVRVGRVGRPAAMVAAAAVVAFGGLGEDYRWLGVVGLTEFVVLAVRRESVSLAQRPWVVLGLRLAASALAVSVSRAPVASAGDVGWLFMLEGMVGLAWVGVRRTLRSDAFQHRRADGRVFAGVAVIGVWFTYVSLPSSGWSPLVAVLVMVTAVHAWTAPPAGQA